MNLQEIRLKIDQLAAQANGDLIARWMHEDRVLIVRMLENTHEAIDARLEIQLLLNRFWSEEQRLRLLIDLSKTGTTIYSRQEAVKREIPMQYREDAYLAIVIPEGQAGEVIRHKTANSPLLYKEYALFYHDTEAVEWLLQRS